MHYLILFLIILPSMVVGQLSECKDIKCEPDNEEISDDWDNFMDLLKKKTFESTTVECPDNTLVPIDYNSDVIWDLRFKLYSGDEENGKRSITYCYCKEKECGTPFQTCMKETRQKFSEFLKNEWQGELEKILCVQNQ